MYSEGVSVLLLKTGHYWLPVFYDVWSKCIMKILGTVQETGDYNCFRGVSDYGTEWKNFSWNIFHFLCFMNVI